MSGILGIKKGMSRLFDDDGRVIPVTVVQCDPNEITQVKTVDKDGYPAIVLGLSKLKKPTKTKKFHYVKEFRVLDKELEKYQKGSQITLENFQEVAKVKISATSKGKGFAGVVKRYHFAGGPASHGSHMMREPGSVGTRAKPGRVQKGKKLAGRMGGEKVTLGNVKVAYIDSKNNLICLKGAVPGPSGTLVTIQII